MKILTIHGLGRTPLSLLSLQLSLQRHGLKTEQFAYTAWLEPEDRIIHRLQQRICAIAKQDDYGIVAHSLGGVLVRSVLSDPSVPRPQHVVMLGTPNQLPRMAIFASKFFLFRFFSGECGQNLASTTFFSQLPPLTVPYTIIAGTMGFNGGWSLFADEQNDGIVAVSETCIISSDRVLQFRVFHSFLMNSPAVKRVVIEALTPKTASKTS